MDQERNDKKITPIVLDTCSICGITNAEYKNWVSNCPRTGCKVCDMCCYKCEHHRSWSGLWECTYKSADKRHEEARKRAQSRFNSECAEVTQIYRERRREYARKRAIKAARAKKTGTSY